MEFFASVSFYTNNFSKAAGNRQLPPMIKMLIRPGRIVTLLLWHNFFFDCFFCLLFLFHFCRFKSYPHFHITLLISLSLSLFSMLFSSGELSESSGELFKSSGELDFLLENCILFYTILLLYNRFLSIEKYAVI